MRGLRLHFCGAMALALVACKDPVDPRARTYPPAGTFPEITVAQLRTGTLEPVSYNVRCVVRDVQYCPPCPRDAVCAPCLPDGIWVSGDVDVPSERVFISARSTRQFTEGTRYLLSLRVNDPNRFVYFEWVGLVGYDVVP